MTLDFELQTLFSYNFDYSFKHVKKQYITDMKRIKKASSLDERMRIFTKYKRSSIDDFYCILLTFTLSIEFDKNSDEELIAFLRYVRPLANQKYAPANAALIGYLILISDKLDQLDSLSKGIFSDFPLYNGGSYQLFYRFYYYQRTILHISQHDFEKAEEMCKRGLAITTKKSQVKCFLSYAIVISWFRGKYFKEEFLNHYIPSNDCVRVLNFYLRHMEYKNAIKLLDEYILEFNRIGIYLLLKFHLKHICLVQVLCQLHKKSGGQEKFHFNELKSFWVDCWEETELIQALCYVFGGKILNGYVMDDVSEFILQSSTVNDLILPDLYATEEKLPSEALQKMLLLKDPDTFPLLDFENSFLQQHTESVSFE
eukprot:NODE_812_length_3739_cov_0.536813.p2 type:complete len:370 gc:universal NODE_812_length_3739_cov_0.536813:2474-3583(+)